VKMHFVYVSATYVLLGEEGGRESKNVWVCEISCEIRSQKGKFKK
jgi:hypothetical protein